MAQVRVTPSGVMDKDTDVSYVNQGNYTDANNIRHRQTDGGNFAGIMPIKGNVLKNTIGGYTATTKKHRVIIDNSDIIDGTVFTHTANVFESFEGSTLSVGGATSYGRKTFASGDVNITTDNFLVFAHGFVNNDTIIYYKGTTLISPLVNGTTYYVVYVDVDNFKLSLTSGGAAINITVASDGYFIPTIATVTGIVQRYLTSLDATFSYSGITYIGNTSYFDITASTDYIITVDNTLGTYATITLIQEYITGAGGTFSVIGSQQLNDDIFLFLAGSETTSEISKVSEIGVLYSTDNDVTFNYVTLIRSKKLGFSPFKRIQCETEAVGNQINLYFTDGLNTPKAIYLDTALKRTQNGLLKNAVIGSTGGRYDLNTINLEASLMLANPSSYFSSVEVVESAGSLTAGNKRYTGRFLTSDYSYTDFLYPTNPVNIFQESFSKPYAITGNQPTEITSKGVRLTLKNIPVGLYSFFELVALEYKGEIFTAKKVQRFSLTDYDSEITIEHTDQGQENIQLSNAELLSITQKFVTAQTLKIFDNRMTLSNLSQQTDLNLNAWAQTINHQINKKTIPFIGYLEDVNKTNISYNLNEYINPNNVLNNTSYMFNDTYRFGIQVQWKSGKWSLPYWVDDIKIDVSNTNIIGNRRVAPTFTDANITTSFASGNDVNIFYVKFSNINLDYIESVTNKPIKDLITGFRIVRSERIPEVLSTGLFFMGASYGGSPDNITPFFGGTSAFFTSGVSTRESFPISYKYKGYVSGAPTTNEGASFTDESDYLFFYSSDYYFNKGGSSYVYNASDKIKLLGVPGTVNVIDTNNLSMWYSTYLELDGNTGTPTNKGFEDFSITNSLFLDDGQEKTLSGRKVFAGAYRGVSGLDIYCRSVNVFKVGTKMNTYAEWNAAGRNNKGDGYFYGQIFRDLGGNKKYPINKEFSNYQSTGHIRNLFNGETGLLTESVFGGDVFNQKTFMLLRMGQERSAGPAVGFGAVVGMYSQNVINSQMYYLTEYDGTKTGSGYSFPQYFDNTATGNVIKPGNAAITFVDLNTIGAGLAQYLNQWLAVSNNNTYSKSYDFKDGTIVENGYNSLDTFDGKKPASIAWSAKKEIGSLKDNYRVFQPSSFSDLDITSGEIATHEIINNNLYTFQQRSVQRQYFRDPSAISSNNGSDIVIGSGSIMVSRGQEITNTGTSKKWSVIKGKTIGGKETVYWFNDRLQKILRFGEDGSRVISDKGMLSYLLNNGKYNINTPEHLRGLGINGVWNDKYSEFIITFKYNDGVSNKAFTLVYDEIKNGFICFHTYFPNLYIPYNNNFFSVNPSASNQLFLHDSGSESTFYATAQDANIEMVMNYEPNISKNFEALQIASEQKPFAANFTTKNHISFLVQNDFDLREDLYYSNIKNDSTGTGVNSNDTSRLWGRWLKIKVNLKSSSVGQKLINAIVKFRVMPRLFNQ